MEGIFIETNSKAIEELVADYKRNKNTLNWYERHGILKGESVSHALGIDYAYTNALRALGIDPAAIR